jgi:aerobic carbon-monoxide dehydrogenase large subunit
MDDRKRPDESGYRFIGKPMPRKEDERLITGRGRFTDDFNLDGQTYAVMVRSPHPHARIVAINSERAKACSASLRVSIAKPTRSAQFPTIRYRRPNST